MTRALLFKLTRMRECDEQRAQVELAAARQAVAHEQLAIDATRDQLVRVRAQAAATSASELRLTHEFSLHTEMRLRQRQAGLASMQDEANRREEVLMAAVREHNVAREWGDRLELEARNEQRRAEAVEADEQNGTAWIRSRS